jgi:hypothetical protein
VTEDEQEAESLKYVSPRVVPLLSGRFAVFDLFDNSDGLPMRLICEADQLPNELRKFKPREIRRPSPQTQTPLEDLA